jgi:hypothetical protein
MHQLAPNLFVGSRFELARIRTQSEYAEDALKAFSDIYAGCALSRGIYLHLKANWHQYITDNKILL